MNTRRMLVLLAALTVLGGTQSLLAAPVVGLVAQYDFNGNLLDSSGNDHHGSVANPDYRADRFGNVGAAYSLTSSNDVISVPGHDDWAFGTGDYLIDVWVLFDRLDPWVNLFGNWYYYNQGGWSIQVADADTGNPYLSLRGLGGNYDWNPQLDTWYHLEISRESGLEQVFVNEQLLGQTAGNTVDVTNNPYQPFLIGDQPWGYSSPFAATEWSLIGAIDDLRIHSEAYADPVPSPPLVALLVMGLPALFASRLRNWR